MRHIIMFCVVSMLLVACRAPEGEERWPGSLRVGQEHPSQLHPQEMRIVTKNAVTSEQEKEVAREIVANKDKMFAMDPPQQILDEAEMIFLRAGRLPELLQYYEAALEERAAPSTLYARTGWLYQRLGIENLALERARNAVKRLPNDPFAHFSVAYALGQQADRYDDPYPEMIGELGTVLQLSPEFSIAGVVARNQLEGEYRRLRAEHGTPATDDSDVTDSAP